MNLTKDRAGRRVWADHAVELPDADGRMEARAGVWRREIRLCLKPAEQTPLSALYLADLASRGRHFLQACLNVVPGLGRDAGAGFGNPSRGR